MKSETQFLEVNGKIKYVHASNLNKYDKWSVTVYPTPGKDLELVRELQADGIKNRMKKDEDGYYIQFSRDPYKVIRGKKVIFDPPECTENGEKIEGDTIGWGSDGAVVLEVYTHPTPAGGYAKAARFHGLKLTNRIPFKMIPKEEKKEDDPW